MFDSIHWHVYGFKGIVDEIKGLGLIGNIIENMAMTPEEVKRVALISYIVLILLAYFVGNISPSTILAKRRGLDIKKEGSGNAGTTNALRVMGKKAGVITLVIDIMKGVLTVVLAEVLAGEACGMYCAVAVIIGHVWPVVYKFKGGKGVATTFGALVAINPMLGIWTLVVVAVVTFLTKRMSAGSISGAIAFPLICLFNEPEFIVWGTLLAFIVLIKHRANIVRLLEGTEPKLGFLDKDKKAQDAVAEESVEVAEEAEAEEVAELAEVAEPAEPAEPADQPADEKDAVVAEPAEEPAQVVDETEPAPGNEQVVDEEVTEDAVVVDEPAEEPKPEKYKRPAVDKTVKKNGKKKKSYPNKHKNGKSNGKSKGKSNKKGGKKK